MDPAASVTQSSAVASARLVAAAAVLIGCDEPSRDRTASASAACLSPRLGVTVYGGTPTATLFPSTEAQRRAIVAIVPPGKPDALCTGVLVTPEVVMTAAHCAVRTAATAPDVQPLVPEAAFAADQGIVRVPARSVDVHPDLDVAVLTIDSSAIEPPVEPFDLMTDSLDDSWLGAPVEYAGMGRNEFNELGLNFGFGPVNALEPDWVVLDGNGEKGACEGDSGGPLLGRADDGTVRVIGLLDEGSSDCVGIDRFTRADRFLAWVLEIAGSLPANPQGCAGLDSAGECYRNTAFSCHDGDRRAETCGPAEDCGFDCAMGRAECSKPEP